MSKFNIAARNFKIKVRYRSTDGIYEHIRCHSNLTAAADRVYASGVRIGDIYIMISNVTDT